MTNNYERLTLASGGLLVVVLCFLTENTAHSNFRLMAAVLLLFAFMLAGIGWMAVAAPNGADRWPWLRPASIVLLSAALLAATAGYAITTTSPADSARSDAVNATDVQETGTAVTDTYALATDTASTAVTDSSATTSVPLTPREGSPPGPGGTDDRREPAVWAGLPGILGLCALAAFAFSIVSGSRGHPGRAVASGIVGTAFAAASLGTHTWKLFDVDSLIKSLEFKVDLQRGPKSSPPQTVKTELAVLYHQPIGPFGSGRDLLDARMRHAIQKSRSEAQQRGEISFAIVVGHVDRRALLPDTAREYASNQGLAHRRALAVQNALGVPTVVTVGGPTHTHRDATPAELGDDRRVDVYFWGWRK